jgi:hypothetical protein
MEGIEEEKSEDLLQLSGHQKKSKKKNRIN